MGLCLALLSSTFSCEEFEDTEELVSNDLEGEDEDEAEIEEESELDDDLFTDDGEDESEEALIMHKGCTPDRPIMCGDGQCYPGYDSCEPLDGCTTTSNPVMCPSGTCVNDFDHCVDKVYDCSIENEIRCGDGVCRENCDGIATNGCPSEFPVYCQNGSCVKYLNQCFDFRCELDNPILCSNLQCREALDSCPKNSLSSMLADTQVEFLAKNGSSIMEQIEVADKNNPNEIQMTLKGERRNLYYPWYTAGFQINDEKGIDSVELEIEIKSLPMSDLRDSKLKYSNMNIQAEAFTNRIFTRGLANLYPHQFLRSFAVEVSIGNDPYNHLLFSKSMEALFKFNIIFGYPNTGLTNNDDDDDDEDVFGDEEEEDLIALEYPNDKPEKIYCLGMLNPENNVWQCVNRVIKEVTEESIMYDIPSPGIYAVLFFPIMGDDAEGPCGWLCRNKKPVTTFFIFYIPMLILFGTYIMMIGAKMYKEAKESMKKFEKQMKVQMKIIEQKAKEMQEEKEEKILDEQGRMKQAEGQDDEAEDEQVDEFSYAPADKMNQLRYMDKLKQDKADVNKIADIINEANYEVKGQTMTFINPLVFNKEATTEQGKEVQEKENRKVELKFKNDELLAKKLKKLGKISVLKEEIESIQKDIESLKAITGDNVLLDQERAENEGPINDRFDTYKQDKPEGRRPTNERNFPDYTDADTNNPEFSDGTKQRGGNTGPDVSDKTPEYGSQDS